MKDKTFWIATGASRFAAKWRNTQITWPELTAKLKNCQSTQETYSQFMVMRKPEQDRIKDVGGFVGGYLNAGKRSSTTVKSRSVLTLDADNGSPEWFHRFEETFIERVGSAAAIYTTHKHRSDAPRFRVVIPLMRDVSPDEYEAIGRMVAFELGIDNFDDTTYQPSRLMYWPSASIDGEFRYFEIEATDVDDELDPDEWLRRYPDWTDISAWPTSSRVLEVVRRTAEKQQDPREKKGVVGAFCRTYDIREAISNFLPDVYEETANGRYTYKGGSTASGVVIYEDDKFAYSNHSTDPAGGRLLNSFDLVRIHKYGDLDESANPETPIGKLPSYRAMTAFAGQDEAVALLMTKEVLASANEDFKDSPPDEDDIVPLERDDKGQIKKSIHNVITVMKNDSRLRGVRTNLLSGAIDVDVDTLPWPNFTGHWSDNDEVQLAAMMERLGFDNMPKQKITDGVQKYADDHARHPVREYLDSLTWDGVSRVDTLLIDYLGAEDTAYTRAVTRKTLCAAVKRVRQPGCKFDTILVINGPQGCGKSTLISKLGKTWFNDSLSLADVSSKAGPEKLQGYWLLEIGELAGMKKTEVETLRSFLSRQDDVYREAYARRPASHPRQSVFVGTTNAGADGYLRDPQGNRRFWDVPVTGVSELEPWSITDEEIDQIWAEAEVLLNKGEPLILPADLAEEALARQIEALESDPRESMVVEYLDTLLPENWEDMSIKQRREYYEADFDEIGRKGTVRRDMVCTSEIWYECFGKKPGDMKRRDSNEIANIMRRIPGWKNTNRILKISGYGRAKVYQREEEVDGKRH